jgi:hypothetical protein
VRPDRHVGYSIAGVQLERLQISVQWRRAKSQCSGDRPKMEVMFGSPPECGRVRGLRHGRANRNDRMLVGFAVTECCWPFVSSLARSVE